MRKYIIYLPMVWLPVVNLLLYGWDLSIRKIWMMLGIAFAEEVFFRGYLLSRITKAFTCRMTVGVAVTSFVFAGMHLWNVLSEPSIGYVLVQCIAAGAIGSCLAIIAYREQSIGLCVLFHFLINVTSMGEQISVSYGQLFCFFIAAMYYMVYGSWLYKKDKEGRKEEKNETLY